MRSAVALGTVLALVVASNPGVALAQKVTLNLTYPETIGDLAFKEIRHPTENDRATQILYKAPGIVLTFYIYGGGPDLPDGADSPLLEKEFEGAKEAIHNPQVWKKAKDVRDGKVDLGKAPHLVPAREGVFKVKGPQGKANSYLYLAALNHVFFKIRCTTSGLKQDAEESNLSAIRIAAGDMIRKLFESSPEASASAPPP